MNKSTETTEIVSGKVEEGKIEPAEVQLDMDQLDMVAGGLASQQDLRCSDYVSCKGYSA